LSPGEPVRKRILELVHGRQGMSKSEIARALEVSWGTVSYHLHILERDRLVYRCRQERRDMFLPARPAQMPTPSAEEPVERIRSLLRKESSINIYDLCARLNLERKVVRRHLRYMEAERLIRIQRAQVQLLPTGKAEGLPSTKGALHGPFDDQNRLHALFRAATDIDVMTPAAEFQWNALTAKVLEQYHRGAEIQVVPQFGKLSGYISLWKSGPTDWLSEWKREDVQGIAEETLQSAGDVQALRRSFAATLWFVDLRSADRDRLFVWLGRELPPDNNGWKAAFPQIEPDENNWNLSKYVTTRLETLDDAKPGWNGGRRCLDSWLRQADWRAPDAPTAPDLVHSVLESIHSPVWQMVVLTDATMASTAWGASDYAQLLLKEWQTGADEAIQPWITLCRASMAAYGGTPPVLEVQHLVRQLHHILPMEVPMGLVRFLLAHWPVDWIADLALAFEHSPQAQARLGPALGLMQLRAAEGLLRQNRAREAWKWMGRFEGRDWDCPALDAQATWLQELMRHKRFLAPWAT